MGRIVTIPAGDYNKHVEPGDVVAVLAWSTKPRLITHVGRESLFLVRLRASWCWRGRRSATAAHPLPLRVEILRRATDETRALAKRFDAWSRADVTDADWKRVCDLQIAAIKCSCGS